MKSNIKSKFFGCILSDGSFRFLLLPSYNSQYQLNSKGVDKLNHPVWTGKRADEQKTEVSTFIRRLYRGSKIK